MNLKQAQLTNNLTIKVVSLILGFLIWSVLSEKQMARVERNLPICFYNEPENLEIKTQNSIKVKISGLRKDLWTNESNAIHIDASFINKEKKDYVYDIEPEHIFLRQGVNLISYKPSKIKIQAHQKQNYEK